jgi:UDP-N-acetylmuramate: L-alanyl-gamma-D-glutamyl-meso-diaminopimelate ligase
MVSMMERNTQNLIELVNDLLDASKLESGHDAARLCDLELRALVDEMRQSMRPLAAREGDRARRVRPRRAAAAQRRPRQAPPRARQPHLERLKFTPRGGHVSLRRARARAGARLGHGHRRRHPREDLRDIFDKYAQARSRATRSEKGTGLGLYITRQLVELHGGPSSSAPNRQRLDLLLHDSRERRVTGVQWRGRTPPLLDHAPLVAVRLLTLSLMHYHLIGICGTAMASLAGCCRRAGIWVTGRTRTSTRRCRHARRLGVPWRRATRPTTSTLSPTASSSATPISRGNPEVEAALNRRLVYRSQAEVVKEEFIRGRRSLVVAGTHGKTTTTSIAAWVLERGGLDPTFLVGGVVQNFGASFRVRESEYFIIEGDEYDTAYFDKGPKFMHYLPELAVVGNIEFDHADIYKDLDAVKLAFRRLMNLVPGEGRLVAGWDSPVVREVVGEMGARLNTRLETFGTCDDARWQARDIRIDEAGTRFLVTREGARWGEFQMPLIGEFNVRNCLSVIVAADAWGVSRESIADALATFKSVGRRMQVRGVERGVTVIDDFAHHPTAVRETLKALRARYKGRLVAVFEPRSWSSRLAVFQKDYVDALGQADYVVVASVFDQTKAAERGRVLDTDELAAEVAAEHNLPSFCIAGADEIVRRLTPELREGDVIAVMSNGGFGQIHDKLLGALKG